MEASTYREPALPATREFGGRVGQRLADPLLRGVREAGDLAGFVGRALANLPGTGRYASEILRQAGVLIAGSALIIWMMEFVVGLECGLEADYALRAYGATGYAGAFTPICGGREVAPAMFGYILAAKVGCGFVAEIGSMRINEELDAMEAQGINPMRYVIGTRLIAAWLVFPFLWAVGLAVHTLGNYVVLIQQLGTVSQGAWEFVHWSFTNPPDLLFGMIKAMTYATIVVLVATYYGFRARGGPIGVGAATARSMVVSLVLIHVWGSVLSFLFWGVNPRAPIGG